MAGIIKYFYTSNVGKCRKTNQDNFFCDGEIMDSKNEGTDGILSGKTSCDKNPVFGVFDGMGGEECGEIAAYLAAKEMKEFSFSAGMEQGFRDFCDAANQNICEKIKELEISSMGTTAAMLRFTNQDIGLCNIGDSKIFLFSNGELSQLSYDHVSISVYGKKPPLTQNLGIPEEELQIDPYVVRGEHLAGDVYLICSDGLTDMVDKDEIKSILEENQGEAAAERLLYRALENGGRDNVTFILIYVTKKRCRNIFKEVWLWLRRK